MARTGLGAAFLLMAVTSSGCMHQAHIVQRDYASGTLVVGIPENTNSWPYHYRDQAIKKANTVCPDCVIVAEGEVMAGVKYKKNRPGIGESDARVNSTTAVETTEWQITFRSKQPMATNGFPNGANAPPGGFPTSPNGAPMGGPPPNLTGAPTYGPPPNLTGAPAYGPPEMPPNNRRQ